MTPSATRNYAQPLSASLDSVSGLWPVASPSGECEQRAGTIVDSHGNHDDRHACRHDHPHARRHDRCITSKASHLPPRMALMTARSASEQQSLHRGAGRRRVTTADSECTEGSFNRKQRFINATFQQQQLAAAAAAARPALSSGRHDGAGAAASCAVAERPPSWMRGLMNARHLLACQRCPSRQLARTAAADFEDAKLSEVISSTRLRHSGPEHSCKCTQ